jgi:hypothetical protein
MYLDLAQMNGFEEIVLLEARSFMITASRPALEPTQPPVLWVPGVKRHGLNLHPVPRSRIMKPYLHPHISSWHGVNY